MPRQHLTHDISIHALREEGDSRKGYQWRTADGISIHALREEGDSFIDNDTVDAMIFLSTPSARRATAQRSAFRNRVVHFYPRPPRGGRRSACWMRRNCKHISIHALREEGDCTGMVRTALSEDISIHALREEGDRTFLLPAWMC